MHWSNCKQLHRLFGKSHLTGARGTCETTGPPVNSKQLPQQWKQCKEEGRCFSSILNAPAKKRSPQIQLHELENFAKGLDVIYIFLSLRNTCLSAQEKVVFIHCNSETVQYPPVSRKQLETYIASLDYFAAMGCWSCVHAESHTSLMWRHVRFISHQSQKRASTET